MFRACYHRRPFLVATLLLLTGIGLVASGVLLEAATQSMNYYAMIAFGVLFVIGGTVTFAMYGKMEKEYREIAEGEGLLRYTQEGDALRENVERQVADLKATNRGLLLVMLFFCVLFGATLPFVLEGGQIMAYICAGLAAFLFLTERIITGFRVKKLRKGTGEFILTRNGAVAGGIFHCWNLPGAALTGAEYRPETGAQAGILELEYTEYGFAGPQSQKVFLPIPERLEKEIPNVLEILRGRMRDGK